MINRVFIHVGPHKTATSSFQHLLDYHRAALLEFGFYYPVGGSYFANAQHDIAHACLKGSGLATLMSKKMSDAEKNFSDVVLSSETFSVLRRKELAYLIETLNETLQPAEIIFLFVRRSDEGRVPSYLAQLQRNGVRPSMLPSEDDMRKVLTKLDEFWTQDANNLVEATFEIIDYSDSVVKNLLEAIFGSVPEPINPELLSARVNERIPIEQERVALVKLDVSQALSRMFSQEDIMGLDLVDERQQFLERDKLIKEIYRLRKEINVIKTSFSWKLTAPIRWSLRAIISSLNFTIQSLKRLLG